MVGEEAARRAVLGLHLAPPQAILQARRIPIRTAIRVMRVPRAIVAKAAGLFEGVALGRGWGWRWLGRRSRRWS